MTPFTRLSWLEATMAPGLFGKSVPSWCRGPGGLSTRPRCLHRGRIGQVLLGVAPIMNARQTELREMLEERRRVLQDQMLRKIRVLREAARVNPTGPVTDCSDDPAHEDIDFALAQMQTETMNKIHAALERIASSEYGAARDATERSPCNGCGPCRLPFYAGPARKRPKKLDCVPAEAVRRASSGCDDRRSSLS